MPRKAREITLNVTVKLVPHPDPERAKRVIAEIVLNQLLRERAERMEMSDIKAFRKGV